MSIIYRDATKEDIAAINELFIELVKTVNKRMEKDNIEPYKDLEKGLSTIDWNEFFKNDDKKIIVAEDNNKVIGFLSIINHNDYIYLDDYCVNNEYRGKGIGSKLMSMADEYAKEKNISRINTHVESANHESIDFYMNKGFKILEKQGHRLFITKEVPLMKTREELIERNNKIINEIFKKIERTCPNLVDMVAIGGSFATGDFYEKSDLDICIYAPDDEKAEEIADKIGKCFIMDGVGYDIYIKSMQGLKRMSRYRNPYVGELKLLDVLYTRNNEVRDKYKELQAELNDNMNNELLIKHNVSNLFSKVLNDYSDSLNANTLKDSYKSLSNFINDLESIIYLLNGEYIEHGTKGIPLEILKMKNTPKGFIKNYNELFNCKSGREISEGILKITNSLKNYLIENDIEIKSKDPITKKNNEKRDITVSELTGTFEELYSNYYNKLKYAYQNDDKFLSFRTLAAAQDFYDFVSDNYNVEEIDIISKYDSENLKINFDAFVNSLKIWKSLYDEKNMEIEVIDTPSEIYDNKKYFTAFPSKTYQKFLDDFNKEGDDSINVSTVIRSEPILNYTIEEAIEFSKENRLEAWVQSFLRDKDMDYASPNFALADGLKLEKRFYYGPVELDLDKITPMRIETDLTGNELDYYMKKVDRMESDFNGENFPPLILEYKDGKFYLTDGSHRYSSLKRLGVKKYYCIIWGNKELEDQMKNDLKNNKGLK